MLVREINPIIYIKAQLKLDIQVFTEPHKFPTLIVQTSSNNTEQTKPTAKTRSHGTKKHKSAKEGIQGFIRHTSKRDNMKNE